MAAANIAASKRSGPISWNFSNVLLILCLGQTRPPHALTDGGRLFWGSALRNCWLSVSEEAVLFGNFSEQKSNCLGQLNSACVTDEHG